MHKYRMNCSQKASFTIQYKQHTSSMLNSIKCDILCNVHSEPQTGIHVHGSYADYIMFNMGIPVHTWK